MYPDSRLCLAFRCSTAAPDLGFDLWTYALLHGTLLPDDADRHIHVTDHPLELLDVPGVGSCVLDLADGAGLALDGSILVFNTL